MTEYFSNKLRWLAVVATLVVVISHSTCGAWEFAAHSKWALPLQVYVTRFMWWPVPFFFMVSGFFLIEQYRKYGWAGVVKKKIMSLYLPVAIWCILLEGLYLPVSIRLGRAPSPLTWLLAPWLLMFDADAGRNSLNVCDHFWYIRELMCYALLSPLLYLAGRRRVVLPVIAALLALAVLLLGWGDCRVGPYHFLFLWKGLFFVPMGVWLGGLLKNRTRLGLRGSFSMGFVALVLVVLFETPWGEGVIGSPILKLLVQVAFVWFAYDVIDAVRKNGIGVCPALLKGIFFVYCAHFLCIKYVGGVWRTAFPQGEITMMAAYFCNIATFFVCLLVQWGLMKMCPKVVAFLTGGRT